MKIKTKLSKYATRVTFGFNNVDLVRTSAGLFRVGSMPAVSKFLRKLKIDYDHIVVLPPEATPAGDNHTGEEFVLWNEIRSVHPRVRNYFGRLKDLANIKRRLSHSVNYVFNAEREKLIEAPNTSALMRLKPFNLVGVASLQKVEIVYKDGNLEIYDDHQLVYDLRSASPHVNVHYAVERLFERIPRVIRHEENLSVLVCGNGDGYRYVTSNFIVSFGNRKIWVDVPAAPALVLAKYNIHIDDITDYLITHNHEDHIEGLSAVIRRAASTKNRINLITSVPIFNALREQFNYMFHRHFDRYVNFIHLASDSSLPYFKGVIHSRRNHHNSKFGTLGLKFEYMGESLGISGDTIYDEALVKKLGRPNLSAKWFKKCGLVFHNVDFVDKSSAQSYYKEVLKLKEQIDGKLLVYHTHVRKSYLQLAKEGSVYTLLKNRVKVKKKRFFYLP